MSSRSTYLLRTLTWCSLALIWGLSGCSSSPPSSGGVFDVKDSAPDKVLDWAAIPDAVPKQEPRARYGNHSPYTVLGKTYHLLPSSKGYSEEGIGSWYGKKFTGRPTSSMEPYDPYAMTAAHKTLPLPCYVRVTNLENGKQIVVRVNDRGPFHDGRIIDLSYAAAHKIGYANKGVARVKVEVIDLEPRSIASPTRPTKPHSPAIAPINGDERLFLQVGAFRDRDTAQTLRQQIASLTEAPVDIYSDAERGQSGIHRVRIGPFSSEQDARTVEEQLRDTVPSPLLIRR